MKNIIAFVEDPGAANFFINTNPTFKKNIILFSVEPAFTYLKLRNVSSFHLKNIQDINDYINSEIKLCVTGTSVNKYSLAFEIISLCRKKNIKTFTIIDSPAAINNIFKGLKKDNFYYLTDYVGISHENIKTQLIDNGIPVSRIKLLQHPYYNEIERQNKKLKSLDYECQIKKLFGKKVLEEKLKNKKIIVFLSELSDGFLSYDFKKSKDYTLSGTSKTIKRTNIVLENILKNLNETKQKYIFILKLHPKDLKSKYKKYFSKIDLILKNENALEVVYLSDFIIGMTTNLLIEAAIMKKEVISIIPRMKEINWLADAVNPSIPFFYKDDQILPALISMFSGDFKYKYKRKDASFCSLSDVLKKIIIDQNL